MKYSLVALLFFIIPLQNEARDYYFHPTKGMDQNDGLSKNQPFKSLSVIASLRLKAGDRIILANGQTYEGSIHLAGQHGTNNQHIVISSENWDQHQMPNAIVDFKNLEAGIYIRDCSHITINNLHLTGNGYSKKDENQSMRCGIIITVSEVGNTSNIILSDLKIKEVYYENPGFQRGASEVKTANGTQKYGWGIRLINLHTRSVIQKVYIANCDISELAHTGIKLTGSDKNIHDIEITNNIVSNVGGPGIQMSEVADVWVHDNTVSHSGSTTDTRKWGRGSGLWTWGASRVLIEKNKFLYANGPGDSAGAHIDFNCDNVIIQYNFSAYNAGGFCEILGNNYNCAYRYNISVNDGHRVKGEDGAFQEGKVFWLSGYQGTQKERKGPVNTYFYNNTIYSDSSITAKFAIDNTSEGILIANNIFCIKGKSAAVLGDQNKADEGGTGSLENVIFKNNLFINNTTWPSSVGIEDKSPIYGDPKFLMSGGMEIQNYTPTNEKLILNKGINIQNIAGDSTGLMTGLLPETDILGKPVGNNPGIGAIQFTVTEK